ncbi:DNA-3-methyladenine glycosylase I [Halolactibacillus halophilus]|uniref:3-methyl-adenine DNA glycosylase I, constitutive n=1 Tax=Halolactibacillus halophilus TaxID=306540 RepID=A0A1I5RE42_9BACI|nr:DNA-3-methyladenine glycosylase I [Halolactibacillus halophilus]GEM02181.1 putative 3-methyl-adenine DNA glycosylase I, constitutive [Halolactibacillus halophilus]SFP56581.1 DNA-3-methyladenine glycosylase I [Halolactibacillus halophilus]
MRCHWVNNDPLYMTYHDHEWGQHKTSTQDLFESLTLELMQSGLSFLTVLKKRDAFKRVFNQYDLEKLAARTENDIAVWLTDKAIIRHKKKLEAVVSNAAVVVSIERKQSFYDYLRASIERFSPNFELNDARLNLDLCKQIAKQMKRDGFKFVGPTTLYSFFQATGFVNDHDEGCDYR